uniref:DUF3854 domain-containing protein n=1 Tax=Eucampia antarctica TaxID=49252 RepID=A0A7S2SH99_9STRA|mmetsp:Transcript_7406/g.6999  ORF Transcript_7406/g.6999 Transcript_7406/m.6999 type:complete len:230 (+) Transcript_7406:3-692(+)|eukprot:CAMPEP_0197842758 /NCGR_PEP_ID=MMETSP1437-20131217/46930_1 /TAXON_ID=49252 ORGANISM="Eucampia antarctica, Strain CCMP1452" /NCGR_SAMPLE_ID=MMETSP1437 /ASSEMBLY_ACC=CAM_ASM_001096 /LENGTH=229 /DNA_ID=CAMNT_0043452693 /DNA_START=557 /DNA_END=1246 /DNA_ORIENTATION=-
MCVPSLQMDECGIYTVKETNIYVKPAMLIPARNAEGLITALHTKPDDNASAKYMWVSSNKSFKLPPNDNFPLFCCYYDWSPGKTVALVEGGLKAYVFAHLAARMKVIGAAGGQFWQSHHELIGTLVRWNAQEVILFPDAGSIVNRCVVLDYFRTFDLVSKIDVKIKIAWWGQEEKTDDLDPDDVLKSLSQVELTKLSLLSVCEFWAFVPGEIRRNLLEGKHKHVFPVLT